MSAMQSVCRAVQAMRHSDASQKEALRFLERFQNGRDAWDLCMQVLFGANWTSQAIPRMVQSTASGVAVDAPQEDVVGSLEMLFFAAQTIKLKAAMDYAQLDASSAALVTNVLWTMLLLDSSSIANANWPVMISTQLELALAALLVQGEALSNSSSAPIIRLLDLLKDSQNSLQMQTRVLNLLACIPEQADGRAVMHVTAGARTIILDNSDGVIQTICAFGVHASSIKCIYAWLRYGAVSEDVAGSSTFIASLFAVALNGDEDVMALACESICELYFRLSQIDAVPSASFFEALAKGLQSFYPKLVEQVQEHASEGAYEEDVPPLLSNLVQVYLEAGEAFFSLLKTDDVWCRSILESVVRVAMFLVEQGTSLLLVEDTFRMWEAFAAHYQEGLSKNSVRQYGLQGSEAVTVFSQLFVALISRHLVMPDPMPTGSELDAFRDFRHVVGDCLKECTEVLQSSPALQLIESGMNQILTASSIGSGMSATSINQLEALAFALRSISPVVDSRESEVLPRIIPLLMQLAKSGNGRLLNAVLLNIGSYADWFYYHAEFLSSMVDLLISSFVSHSRYAGRSFKFLCESNSSRISMDQVSAMYQSMLGTLTAENVSTGRLSSSASEVAITDVCEGVAFVLSEQSIEQLASVLDSFVSVWLNSGLPMMSLHNVTAFIKVLGDAERERHVHQLMQRYVTERICPLIPALVERLFAVSMQCQSANSTARHQYSQVEEDEWAAFEVFLDVVGVLSADLAIWILQVCQSLLTASMERGDCLFVASVVALSVARRADCSLVTSFAPQRSILALALQMVRYDGINTEKSQRERSLLRPDVLRYCSSIVSSYHEALMADAQMQDMLLAMFSVVQATLQCNSEMTVQSIDEEECGMALMLLARLQTGLRSVMNVSISEAVTSSVLMMWRLVILKMRVSFLINDVFDVVRRHFQLDPVNCVNVFVQASVETELFESTNEREAWQKRFMQAMQNERGREVKDMLSAFISYSRRRFQSFD